MCFLSTKIIYCHFVCLFYFKLYLNLLFQLYLWWYGNSIAFFCYIMSILIMLKSSIKILRCTIIYYSALFTFKSIQSVFNYFLELERTGRSVENWCNIIIHSPKAYTHIHIRSIDLIKAETLSITLNWFSSWLNRL